MILDIVLIVLGIVLVLWGADRLTDGAVALAGRIGIPQIVIGLTVVAFGTSAPELFVSLTSALKGTPDLAVGNVVGSNIFNALLIVGCAAMVAPMTVSKSTVRKDIPFAMLASFLLPVFCADARLSRVDASVLFLIFLSFMAYTLRTVKSAGGEATLSSSGTQASASQTPIWKALGLLLLGLGCLIVGSNVFVDHATSVAASLGVSEAIIGLTIVAGGTSLPELATSVVAARKGNSAIAIGNVIGSNVMNILLILGLTGLIAPMQIQGITMVDLSMLVVSMLLLWIFSFTKCTIAWWEGAVLTGLFIAYMSYLIAGTM